MLWKNQVWASIHTEGPIGNELTVMKRIFTSLTMNPVGFAVIFAAILLVGQGSGQAAVLHRAQTRSELAALVLQSVILGGIGSWLRFKLRPPKH